MWKLYDQLIEAIPENILVEEYAVGVSWTYVQASNGNMGVALTVKAPGMRGTLQEDLEGKSLREIAGLIKSWNFIESSIGMAAINCYYNSKEKLLRMHAIADEHGQMDTISKRKRKEAFAFHLEEIRGKKVACIGHFPEIERQIGSICELSVLERNPGKDDYPDSACEYILKEQDYVFVTGMAFTNKTMPRLLQILKGTAKVSLVGPSVPCASVLQSYGVDNISGFYVTEYELLKKILRRGGKTDIFQAGEMISIDL